MNENEGLAAPVRSRGSRRLLRASTSLFVSVAAAAALAAPAQAATTLTVTTHEDALDIPVPDSPYPYKGFNQGWWAAETGHDWDGYDNTNYATGWSDYYGVTRSFFSFSMARVKGKVTAATLQIPRGCATSPDATELVKFWDVTTPADALNRGSAPTEPTFRDIGGGTEYGRSTISTSASGGTVSVTLNSKAVTAINKAAASNKAAATDTSAASNKTKGKSYFSVGAAVMTLSKRASDEAVFRCTGQEPASLVLSVR